MRVFCLWVITCVLGVSVAGESVSVEGDDLIDYGGYVWRGVGNEPPWSVLIGDRRIRLEREYGSWVMQTALPRSEVVGGAVVYEVGLYVFRDPVFGVRIGRGVCRDTMSDVPYPYWVELSVGVEEFRGCGGLPVHLLSGARWVVEAVSGIEVISGSEIDLVVSATGRFGGRIGGSSGCNDYWGRLRIGEVVSIGRLAMTKKACRGPLMRQEQRFLSVLESVRHFDVDEDGGLVLAGADEGMIRARRESLR